MKVYKKVSSVKIIPTNSFSSQIYPSTVPMLNKETVVKTKLNNDEPKKVVKNLKEMKKHYLSIVCVDYGEELVDIKGAFHNLINNILVIEGKLISIKKKKCYEKLKSKELKDVDEKIEVIEKLAFEVENLLQDIYSCEQMWTYRLKLLTKQEKKELIALSQENFNNIDELFKWISNKWKTYREVYGSMKRIYNNKAKAKEKVNIKNLQNVLENEKTEQDELHVS